MPDLQQYKSILEKLKASLEAEIDASRASAAPVVVDGSIGRVSRGDALQMQQMSLEMMRRRQERLQRVHNALLRIRSKTYGVCIRCEEPIDEARLEAYPDVLLCVDCASESRR